MKGYPKTKYRTVTIEDMFGKNAQLKSHVVNMQSQTHALSMATEFAQQWFLKRFDKDFFKTFHISGKHSIDDFRNRIGNERIKKHKPICIMTPSIAEITPSKNVDVFGLGSVYDTGNYDRSFFKDYQNNEYMSMQLEDMLFNFRFDLVLGTRAQQLDVSNFMNLAFRCGFSERKRVDLDYFIPKNFINSIAEVNGFMEDGKIVRMRDFLSLLNKKSELPIMYKFRGVTHTHEFFVRFPNVDLRYKIPNVVEVDEGQEEGFLYNNFRITMDMELRFPQPLYYVLYNTMANIGDETGWKDYEDGDMVIGAFTVFTPAMVNDKGWNKLVSSEYVLEEYEINPLEKKATINIKELIEQIDTYDICEYMKTMMLSPDLIIECKTFNTTGEIPCSIDWETYDLIIDDDSLIAENIYIVLYDDTSAVHDFNIQMKDMNNNRYNESKNQDKENMI